MSEHRPSPGPAPRDHPFPASRVEGSSHGELILIGGLATRHRERVREFCLRSGAPVYAEPLSGLREDPRLDPILVHNERMLARGGFDSVIRIGNVPVVRFWRDLDTTLKHVRVSHYSDLPFAGLP